MAAATLFHVCTSSKNCKANFRFRFYYMKIRKSIPLHPCSKNLVLICLLVKLLVVRCLKSR